MLGPILGASLAFAQQLLLPEPSRAQPEIDVHVRLRVEGSPPSVNQPVVPVYPRQIVALELENLTGAATDAEPASEENVGPPSPREPRPDPGMPVNWALVWPGKTRKVLTYGTDSFTGSRPDVLARTGAIPPGQGTTLEFEAPETPGDYPFVCTATRRCSSVRGVLRVLPVPGSQGAGGAPSSGGRDRPAGGKQAAGRRAKAGRDCPPEAKRR